MNNKTPILITLDDEDGYFPTYPPGFFVKPSELKPVIDGLIAYVNAYSDEDIKVLNKQKEKDWFSTSSTHKKSNTNKYGYVYVFKCSDKYKIGYSKNVEQRIKQLDIRPFTLELTFKVYSENAYDIEHEVHNRLSNYMVANEWFSNISETLIINTIKEVAEDLKCDIQY